MISVDKRMLEPLSTTLGLEDLYDLIEVIRIDGHNRRVMNKALEDKNKRR